MLSIQAQDAETKATAGHLTVLCAVQVTESGVVNASIRRAELSAEQRGRRWRSISSSQQLLHEMFESSVAKALPRHGIWPKVAGGVDNGLAVTMSAMPDRLKGGDGLMVRICHIQDSRTDPRPEAVSKTRRTLHRTQT
jgi:hypothetical protein